LDKPANNLEPEFQRRDLFGMVGAAAVSAGVLGATDVLAAEKRRRQQMLRSRLRDTNMIVSVRSWAAM
jgi:hypothetical protein